MIPVVIGASILFFGLVYSLLSWSFNPSIESFNSFVDLGIVTEQTSQMFNLTLDLWRAIPLFFIIGLVLYCIEKNKGTDLPAQVFFEYLILMVVGTYVSVYVVLCMGLSLDGITQGIEGTLLTDVSEQWDSSGTRGTVSALMYYFCLLLGFAPAILYMIHPILKRRETRELFGGESQQDEVFSNGREVVLEQV